MAESSDRDTVLVINRDGMGSADTALQHTLIQKYLYLIEDADLLPAAICLYTDGVRLVCDGSPVLDELRALEARGVRLVVCSTCLNALGLADAVQVGIVGGMTDIIDAQWRAGKVITL